MKLNHHRGYCKRLKEILSRLIRGDLAPLSNFTGKLHQLLRVQHSFVADCSCLQLDKDTHFSFKDDTVVIEYAFIFPATSNTLSWANITIFVAR